MRLKLGPAAIAKRLGIAQSSTYRARIVSTSLRPAKPARGRVLAAYSAAALAFVLYVGSVFTLPQVRENEFDAERASLATAVSNVVYATPFGTSDAAEISQRFRSDKRPLWQVLQDLPDPGQAGDLVAATNDGDGFGLLIVSWTGMRLFGVHAASLQVVTLLLMGLSALALLLRFVRQGQAVVVQFFSALTILLFTKLVWQPGVAAQIPIGGLRYFSLVGVLPAFHLAFELLGMAGPGSAARKYGLLIVQMAILVIAILVRTHAATLLAAIAVIWSVSVWRHRRQPEERAPPLRTGAVIACTGFALFVAISALLPPNSQDRGLVSLVWHRAVISLGISPAWPFGDVPQVFDCSRYIAGGISSIVGLSDRTGHCIWVDYGIRHDIPVDEMVRRLYGVRYEEAMRSAFLAITYRYPMQVLATFFYEKPRLLLASLWSASTLNLRAYSPLSLALLAAALANIAGYIAISANTPPLYRIRLAGIVLLFAAFSTPAYFIAWALPYTIADLLFYCVFGAELAAGALLAASIVYVRRVAA